MLILCIFYEESQVVHTTNSGIAQRIVLLVSPYLELVELYRLVVVNPGFLAADSIYILH